MKINLLNKYFKRYPLTNYYKREKYLIGLEKPRICYRTTNKQITISLVKTNIGGDLPIFQVGKKEILNLGLEYKKTLLSSYLLGLLFSNKFSKTNFDNPVFDSGKNKFKYNSNVCAVYQSILDLGILTSRKKEFINKENFKRNSFDKSTQEKYLEIIKKQLNGRI